MTNKFLKGDDAPAITGEFVGVDDELDSNSDNVISNRAITEVISSLQSQMTALTQ